MRRGPGTALCPDLATDNGVFPTDILGRWAVVRRGPFAASSQCRLFPMAPLSAGRWVAVPVGLVLSQPCAAQPGRAQPGTCSAVVAALCQDARLSSALHVRTCRGASREPAVLPPPPWCQSWLPSQHQSKISHWCLFLGGCLSPSLPFSGVEACLGMGATPT